MFPLLFTHTTCFCIIYTTRVQCFPFYLHIPRVFVMFTSQECNVYTFISNYHVFLLSLHHGNAIFPLLFTHITLFCYVYITGLQCLHFYFQILHIFVKFTLRKCNISPFIYTLRVFYVYISRMQCLHFYFHIPRVVVKFTSRECNVYADNFETFSSLI
jgi:hypothetical protein